MPKQRGSESEREAAKVVERTAQRGLKRKRMTGVSRKKQLQRLKPAEDERKLQIITRPRPKGWGLLCIHNEKTGENGPCLF